MQSLFTELQERGLVSQCTDDRLGNRLSEERLTVYAGFDPTDDSLHLGHLVPVMALARFQRAGHRVIALIGGATGMIGDPSGRSSERNLQSPDVVQANVSAIEQQLAKFLDFDGDNAAVVVDNRQWLGAFNMLAFLRDVGKHFSISSMLAKDSVKSRLASEHGISFTEFSYQLMQAYDFLHLFDNFDCTLQIGGSDQWGNITAGMDLIRKVRGEQAFGLTCPLATTASGDKFGKSAGNAVWLDASRTSPWELFQYLVRQEDADVMKLLRLYTFLPDEELLQLEQRLSTAASAREAQRKLAFEVTALVHGQAVAAEMVRAADAMFSGEIAGLSESTLESLFASVPSTDVAASALSDGIPLSQLLVTTKVCTSLTRARQLIASGGAYINNVRADSDLTVSCEQLATSCHIVLRSGKKNYHLIRVR